MSLLRSKKVLNEALRNNKNIIVIEGELLKELQNVELEMLRDINDVCRKNSIPLLLGGGSLLGAVRHGGFIPWDDDIDLNLQRSYVNKFLHLIKENLGHKYYVQYNSGIPAHPFIKIRKKGTIFTEVNSLRDNEGISIDIFIIENVPNNIIIRYIYGVICTAKLFIASCLEFYDNKNKAFYNIVKQNNKALINYYIKKIIGFFFSFDSYYERVIKNDKYFSKYKNKKTKYVSIPTGRGHYFGELYKSDMFSNITDIDFEGISCKIQKKYKDYLINLYGDNYMEVPSKEKQEHHYVLRIEI